MTAIRKIQLTPQQYLETERAADFRSEYLAGEAFALAGTSFRHAVIVLSLASELRARLRGRCKVVTSEVRVRVARTGLYTYPDIAVACGEAQFDDEHKDTLLNPSVLVEVLSPSTELYDRGKKFRHYKQLDSLQHYVLVAQEEPSVECFTRTDSGWLLSAVDDLTGTLDLAQIECSVPLSIIYDDIGFGPES